MSGEYVVISKADLERGRTRHEDLLNWHLEYVRPRTRGECGDERPCPWVGCRYHLYLEVRKNGSLQINHPNTPPWELQHSCCLDVVEDHPEGMRLHEIGEYMNVVREAIRKTELIAIQKLISRKELK